MKKLLVIGSIVLVLGLSIVGLTTPLLAHGPDEGEAAPANEEAWEAMHEACTEGDWEAMAEAAEEVHGNDFGDMPGHDEDGSGVSPNQWGGMGGGMMGRGWGDMSGGMMGG